MTLILLYNRGQFNNHTLMKEDITYNSHNSCTHRVMQDTVIQW